MTELLRHLLHNEHGEWTFVFAFLSGFGVGWVFLKTHFRLLWRRLVQWWSTNYWVDDRGWEYDYIPGQDGEIEPEYDFKEGVRGKYAHRRNGGDLAGDPTAGPGDSGE